MYKSLLQLALPLLLSVSLAPAAPAQADFSGYPATAFPLDECDDLKAKVEEAIGEVEAEADKANAALNVVYETVAKDADLQAQLKDVKKEVVIAYKATQAMEPDSKERAKSQAKVDTLYAKQVSLTADIEVNADLYDDAIEDIDDACKDVLKEADKAQNLLAQYINQCELTWKEFKALVKRITDAIAETQAAKADAKVA